jgi:TatD DNase family protein
VVHSFDGSAALAAELVAMGLSIGINGCSLKTQENLDVAASIPRSALMIETDAPWCDIRPTHAGHKHVRTLLPVTKAEKFETGKGVKSRNEPALIRQVLEILAAVRNDPELELAAAIVHNTNALFFPHTQTKVAE